MNITDLAITSLETITAFDIVSGDFLFQLDELQDATISNTQDKQDITGKAGRKLTSIKRNKAVTISGSNGMVSGGMLELQTGGTFENKVTDVMWTDYLIVNNDAATTNYIAVGTSGAEILECYIRNSDGTLGTELTQDSAAAAGKFAYAPANKGLTFSGVADGTEIVVIYNRRITANVLGNDSDSFSKKATLYVDAMAEDKCNNIYRVQFYIPKADFSGEFSIELGDNQTTHNFEAESLSGACVAGKSDLLWTYTVFGVNAVDTTADTNYITLNKTTAAIGTSGSVTLTATTNPDDQTITWKSSNTGVATVSDGVVSAVAAGTTIITADFTYGSKVYTAYCTVTVA